ncbi:complex I subunit 4 family protein [Geminisphaera colitermitum]|uniref:complex I subunit 4 family protein n=1 Tax=Geminisphaera colitermitum TaxID=1148786 RepID=UPI001E2F3183|nr:NADH-quinone oxidoreductase subunit M [Geminisphaera colitermitum]
MNLLPWTIYISLAGALLTLLAGRRSPAAARIVAITTALAAAAIVALAAIEFTPSPDPQTLVNLPWIAELGIQYHLAADGISLTLVVLTAIAALAGILFSWNITDRTGEFFALYLALIGGVYGVFLSADAFVFFVFYEIAIVPKYFLVAKWGSTNREYGAMKLVLYSFAGSALVMAGLLWAHATAAALPPPHAVQTFSLTQLAEAATHFSHAQQLGMFALVFTGFAVLAGMFPFHTWAPTGHVAAPTAASMLLAGVVMKLGAYGCLRVAIPLFVEGYHTFAPFIGWLAVIGIVYAGFIALIQDDFKFVIGYSSVSHMGFVLLGLAAANERALSGAVLQMFSHGIIAGLLFAVVGRMVYERTHTRNLADLRALPLHRLLPFAATTFVIAGLASMGLPGFSGFPAELSILVGAWQTSRLWALIAAIGILIAAAFTLRAIQVSFFGKTSPVGASLAKPASAVDATNTNVPPLPPPPLGLRKRSPYLCTDHAPRKTRRAHPDRHNSHHRPDARPPSQLD